MPTPDTGESHDDFVSRCVPEVIDDGAADSPEQAVAICERFWEDREEAVLERMRTRRRPA
jgi:hypothetical protein